MNAKEISDVTLESVTPADNDLLLIYDTSAGTTGKATLADIAPKIKRGTVIIPSSTSGVYVVNLLVTFNTPFDDDNYAVELTRAVYSHYADTAIIYHHKTKNGFYIEEFCNNNQIIRPAHEVSWVAIKI